ncbi:MAG TPA: hypothetical protein VNE38_06190, partial [Ktedonobacteraceae bacterium]|nr:hypothetical protein [Ktedonobacteraceae bacterium]
MHENNFWGQAQSKGFNTGMIVRLGLALAVLAGSVTLAWTLLGSHFARAASSVNTVNTHAHPWSIVFDAQGNAWVAEPNCNPAPVCIAPPTGSIEEFHLVGGLPVVMNTYTPAAGIFNPTSLQLDGAGHVWFTDPTNDAIGELTIATNTWTKFTAGISANAMPFGLALDKTGNLWFAERAQGGTGKIGFFNTGTHAVVETAVTTTTGQPDGMTYSSATNTVWFAEDTAPKIGSFTATTNGIIPTPIAEHTSNANINPPNPHLVTLDKSGNVWYSEQGSDMVGEMNPTTFTTTQFSAAGSICPTPGVTPTPCTNTYIDGISSDSNGTIWFDETQTKVLGSLNPANGAVTLYPLPQAPGDGLTVDPQNNVWVSMQFSQVLGELPAGSAPTPTPGTSPTTTPTLLTGPVYKTWYFAEGRVGGGFNEYLSLDNPTTNACQVTITYLYTPDGQGSLTKTLSVNIGAGTRYEEGVDGDLGTSSHGFGITDSAIVTVDNTVTPACTGIVAER